jgi:tetratricopeptide (TPR) repeat protein
VLTVGIVRMHDDLMQESLLKKDKKAASFVTIGEPDIRLHRKNGTAAVEIAGLEVLYVEHLAAFPGNITTEAWLAVGSAFHSNLALHKAHDLLAPAAARQDADSHVLALAAQVAQELGDYESAETLWRRLIQEASAQVVPSAADPVRAEICNNLAYVLMASGDASKLPEARQLAEQAVAASPDTSSFYDTLARIYSHQGKRDLAVKAFRTAREKDPNNVEAMFKHNAVSLVSPLPQLRHRTQSPV